MIHMVMEEGCSVDRGSVYGPLTQRPLQSQILKSNCGIMEERMPTETNDQHDARMEWWREARFGMFIHWGLYTILAGEWKGQPISGIGSWSMHGVKISVADYEPLIHQFNPVAFSAADVARLAKKAGMKYIVITSKHHEGFCLFDSEHTDYDVMSTPFKRDIMKELAEACRAEGLKFGFYHSLIDWHHPHYPVKGDPYHPMRDDAAFQAQERDFDKYLDYLHAQVRELLTNYGRIDVLWFDFSYYEMTGEAWRSRELLEMVFDLQPHIIINNRLGKPGFNPEIAGKVAWQGDFETPEGSIPPPGQYNFDWETCSAMSDSWAYKKDDHNYQSAEQLIRNLADIAGKGGNYLLNIGPMADGSIPTPEIERLEAMGRWLAINGESVYGTKASAFDESPSWGPCTTRHLPDGSTRLYLHVFEWPADGRLAVPSIAGTLRHAYLLSDKSQTALATQPSDNGLLVSVPDSPPDKAVTVVALEIEPSTVN